MTWITSKKIELHHFEMKCFRFHYPGLRRFLAFLNQIWAKKQWKRIAEQEQGGVASNRFDRVHYTKDEREPLGSGYRFTSSFSVLCCTEVCFVLYWGFDKYAKVIHRNTQLAVIKQLTQALERPTIFKPRNFRKWAEQESLNFSCPP